MRDNVMVKSHQTLRCVIYKSLICINQFKTFMLDHVTQGFKGVTDWVDNQTIKQRQSYIIALCNDVWPTLPEP